MHKLNFLNNKSCYLLEYIGTNTYSYMENTYTYIIMNQVSLPLKV